MLTGSMASNYWGVPRTTHDLDFVVQLHEAFVAPLVAAFAGDYFIQEASVRSALQPPYQFNALDQRSALKIDFWVLRDDPFELSMFSRRRQVTLFGTAAAVAAPEDVLLHKLLWNRLTPSERQLHDAAGIWALQRDQLDTAYLKQWAAALQLEDALQRIERGEIRPKAT
jgi:hypothetical protein